MNNDELEKLRIEEKQKEEARKAQAPFNAAVAAMERIGKLLEEIKLCSFYESFDPFPPENARLRQAAMIKMVRQLLINSLPLVKLEEDQKELIEEVNSLVQKPGHMYPLKQKGWNPIIPMYSPQLDDDIETVIMKIMLKLQKQGIFMPSSKDGRI